MALVFKVKLKPGCVLMVYQGYFDRHAIDAFTSQIMETCQTHQATKMLIDTRKVKGDLSTLERFNLGLLGAAKYLKAKMTGKILRCRFATVSSKSVTDSERLTENAAVNRGLNVRAFTEMKEALHWLMGDQEKGGEKKGKRKTKR